jgi:primosomal replication protein N
VKRNQVVIDGRVARLGVLRRTPAGTPAIDMLIAHASTQQEAGHERQVHCELSVVALGDAALEAAKFKREQNLRIKGFLARRRLHTRELVLHMTAAKAISGTNGR